MICQQLTPERFGFVWALFYRRQYHVFAFTGHYSLATRHSPLATRHSPLPPKTLPRWLLRADRPPNCERSNGPDLAERTLYPYYAPNQAIPAENPIRFSPLAAAQPLNILSRPETLNGRRFSSNNALSGGYGTPRERLPRSATRSGRRRSKPVRGRRRQPRSSLSQACW